MRKMVNNKNLLLAISLIIGLATLLSHSVKVEIKSDKKVNTEQTSGEQQPVINTPSDALTVNFFTLQIDGLLEIIPVFQSVEKVFKVVPVFQKETTSFQQTLFRFIIAPNAP